MSLHRVLQRLARRVTKHERGTSDGHEPTAEAHRVFLEHAREDFAAVQLAINAGAEIDRLRSLPVIATCGDCWHLDHAEPRERCEHPSHGRRTVAVRRLTTTDAAPPTWCPLRGGAR